MLPWLRAIVEEAHERLLALDPSHPARAYLADRGVTEAELRLYRIGYVGDTLTQLPCTQAFWDWARRHAFDRLVFPFTDPFGAPIGLQVRKIAEKGYENFTDPTMKALYPATFGLHVALPAMYTRERAVLVEGVFDYLATARHAPETLAILTSAASTLVRRLLARYVTEVVALLDMDGPGRRGCYRLAGLPVPPEYRQKDDMTLRTPKPPPFLVRFPLYTEHDPDDLRKAGKHAELARLVIDRRSRVVA